MSRLKPSGLSTIYVALPVLNEWANLPAFIACLNDHDYQGAVKLFVCVNQPEEWWQNDEKVSICNDNQDSISYLKQVNGIDIHIIDRSSKGKGWIGRQHGVGYARREVMLAIANVANDTDIIVSLDADTAFNSDYFSVLAQAIDKHPQATAISVPYYHRLTLDEIANRAILRYEIYMRYYALNLLRIECPYAFTALGSAIALTVANYKSVGGITPKMSGEDFYFLQKLRKKGPILTHLPTKVFPAARFSDRVYFGTGPAMIKGANGNWESYPIYNYLFFNDIKNTYDLLPLLFQRNIPTPMDDFLSEIFNDNNIWNKIRNNATTEEGFIRACHEKIDGLRILQYLKWRQKQITDSDEVNMKEFIKANYPGSEQMLFCDLPVFSFKTATIELLDKIRNFLVIKEEEHQKRCINVPG